eukprot:TRINITY_DN4186_c0_g1_i1.p1 TRINITY_DN4186_c0_g1~~TRINITY_DN4186_c0_g1_i1.p1  ORF type:complete len:327 (+),score=38.34 TRINITY_DN4186_c0_g1_i1:305-1285(+)
MVDNLSQFNNISNKYLTLRQVGEQLGISVDELRPLLRRLKVPLVRASKNPQGFREEIVSHKLLEEAFSKECDKLRRKVPKKSFWLWSGKNRAFQVLQKSNSGLICFLEGLPLDQRWRAGAIFLTLGEMVRVNFDFSLYKTKFRDLYSHRLLPHFCTIAAFLVLWNMIGNEAQNISLLKEIELGDNVDISKDLIDTSLEMCIANCGGNRYSNVIPTIRNRQQAPLTPSEITLLQSYGYFDGTENPNLENPQQDLENPNVENPQQELANPNLENPQQDLENPNVENPQQELANPNVENPQQELENVRPNVGGTQQASQNQGERSSINQ